MNIKTTLAAASAAILFMFSSCSKDDDDVQFTLNLAQTQISYNEENVWSEVGTDKVLSSQFLTFSHSGFYGEWGLVWNGFCPARCTSTTDPGEPRYLKQFDIMTGGGLKGGGTPYLVAFWDCTETETTPLDSRSVHITFRDTPESAKHPFIPKEVYITNTCYTYYTMLKGDSFTHAFKEGDSFKLIAHGVHLDGSESTLEFSLANCQGSDKEKWYVNTWEKWTLDALGTVTDIYFTMQSTDNGMWGMNTPSYFAMDGLQVVSVLPDND